MRHKQKIIPLLIYILYFLDIIIIWNLKSSNQISSSIYNNIQSVSIFSLNQSIIFHLKPNNINKTSLPILIYETVQYGKPMILLPNAFILIEQNTNFIHYKLLLPFIANYSGYIKCLSSSLECFNKNNINYADINRAEYYQKTIKSLKASFSLKNFSNNENLSQMQCFSKHKFQQIEKYDYSSRWCEMRKVFYYNTHLVFSFPFIYEFPAPFIIPGSRAAPYDRTVDRLVYEPLVTQSTVKWYMSFINISSKNIYYNISYITGRFFNSMMLWHTLFDFMVPLYQMILKIEPEQRNHPWDTSRNIFLIDNEHPSFWNLITSLSDNIMNIRNDITPRFFERLILGLEKTDQNPDPFRTSQMMPHFSYDFKKRSISQFRHIVFQHFNLSIKENIPNYAHPTILLIKRSKSKRDIVNHDEIKKYILSQCSYCNVKIINFANLAIHQQLKEVARASVLMGIHGSGLSHVLWLKPSDFKKKTFLVEFLPFGYWCRDWYEVGANAVGVDYYSVMNQYPPLNMSKDLQYCLKDHDNCLISGCNEELRDQLIKVEIDTFSRVWNVIQSNLDQNRNSH